MVWWREMRNVTAAPPSLTSAGRGTPVVPLVIAPLTRLLLAGEDLFYVRIFMPVLVTINLLHIHIP